MQLTTASTKRGSNVSLHQSRDTAEMYWARLAQPGLAVSLTIVRHAIAYSKHYWTLLWRYRALRGTQQERCLTTTSGRKEVRSPTMHIVSLAMLASGCFSDSGLRFWSGKEFTRHML